GDERKLEEVTEEMRKMAENMDGQDPEKVKEIVRRALQQMANDNPEVSEQLRELAKRKGTSPSEVIKDLAEQVWRAMERAREGDKDTARELIRKFADDLGISPEQVKKFIKIMREVQRKEDGSLEHHHHHH
uniref:Gogy n=1 Tax=synthetic construct TaxID=32630 RepID=UPI001AD9519D|nr:Chain A, Gogy [synthetic construct]